MSRPYDNPDVFWSKFWSKVDKTDTCWLWTGNKNAKGYGRVELRGTGLLAHRVMLFWFGRIPTLEKMRSNRAGITLHSCDVPSCVNPEHLRIGTAAENMADIFARQRMPSKAGEQASLAKLTNREALDVLVAAKAGVSRAALAEKFGVNRSSIDNIVVGKSYKQAFAQFCAMAENQVTGA